MKPTNQQFAQAFIRDVITKNAGTTAKKPSGSATMPSSIPESNPAPPIPKPRSVKECRHIRANGLRCRGLAIKNTRYCYNHARAYQRKRVHQTCLSIMRSEYSGNPKSIPNSVKYDDRSVNLFDSLDLPILEDASSLQIVYNALIHATLTQQISERRAACVHRMLRSFLVLLPSYYGDQIHPDAIEDIAVERDPEPLRIPFMKQFTMESVIAPTEEDFVENEVDETEVDESDVDESEVDESEFAIDHRETNNEKPETVLNVDPRETNNEKPEAVFNSVPASRREAVKIAGHAMPGSSHPTTPSSPGPVPARRGGTTEHPESASACPGVPRADAIPQPAVPTTDAEYEELDEETILKILAELADQDVSEIESYFDTQETNNENPVLASRREAVKIAGHAMPGSGHTITPHSPGPVPAEPGRTAELSEPMAASKDTLKAKRNVALLRLLNASPTSVRLDPDIGEIA